ncbi:hypothetical protein Tco_0496788 [Tanacetum coccineum]
MRETNVYLFVRILANYKHSQLKNKSFEEIQMLFDNTMKWVDSFVPMDTEVVEGSKSQAEGSKKRTREELESDNSKKQKIDENVEAKVVMKQKMKKLIEISSYDSFSDGSSRRPKEAYKRVLWGDLKVMFEPYVESEVWINLQGYSVTVQKLFSSSGVHFVRFQNLHIFMLVEKKYPLIPATITKMLNKKLQTDQWNEMCYQILKLMTKQRESSAPKKPIIIKISNRKQPDPETPILTTTHIGLENLIEAQALSYTIAKNVEEYEAHQEDPDTRIDPKSHKESLEAEKVGRLEIRDTLLATPTRSPRTESLSLDKDKLKELMASKISSSSSNPTSHRTRHIQGAIAHMSRRHGYMLQHMRKSFMHRHDMNNLVNKLEEILREVVPKMVDNTIDQNMQENLPWLVKKALRQERENAKAELASMVADAMKKEQERTRAELSS